MVSFLFYMFNIVSLLNILPNYFFDHIRGLYYISPLYPPLTKIKYVSQNIQYYHYWPTKNISVYADPKETGIK